MTAHPRKQNRTQLMCWRSWPLLLMLLLLFGVPQGAAGQLIDELQQRPRWQAPPPLEVMAELRPWLESLDLPVETWEQIEGLWAGQGGQLTAQQTHEALLHTVALADPESRAWVQRWVSSAPMSIGLDPWRAGEQLPEIVRDNFRLAHGRWLAQHSYYDEALEQLGELAPADVVDPGTLLFYQSVVHHRLLNREQCLESIAQLLQHEETIPRRYASVARLMQADIQPLKEDSLDEVARLMEDIQRRLGFGRAGARVRKEEDDVIAKLDKMIEKLEQQQQQQQQQAGASAQGNRSNNPAQDSAPLGGSGPGDVDQRPIGSGADWGNLPPKQRQQALQQMSKDLPAHYREVIEEYFRRLARDAE